MTPHPTPSSPPLLNPLLLLSLWISWPSISGISKGTEVDVRWKIVEVKEDMRGKHARAEENEPKAERKKVVTAEQS